MARVLLVVLLVGCGSVSGLAGDAGDAGGGSGGVPGGAGGQLIGGSGGTDQAGAGGQLGGAAGAVATGAGGADCLFRTDVNGGQICITPRCPAGTVVGSAAGLTYLTDSAGRRLLRCLACGGVVDCACGDQCGNVAGGATWCTDDPAAVTPWGTCTP